MKSKKAVSQFYLRARYIIISLVLLSTLLSLSHTFFHNKFDHLHDDSCSVYVLEQLYFSADVEIASVISTIFLLFIFINYLRSRYQFQAQKTFNSRAPPLFS